MTERKLQRNRRGFTLTEVLLALAILIILLALATYAQHASVLHAEG